MSDVPAYTADTSAASPNHYHEAQLEAQLEVPPVNYARYEQVGSLATKANDFYGTGAPENR